VGHRVTEVGTGGYCQPAAPPYDPQSGKAILSQPPHPTHGNPTTHGVARRFWESPCHLTGRQGGAGELAAAHLPHPMSRRATGMGWAGWQQHPRPTPSARRPAGWRGNSENHTATLRAVGIGPTTPRAVAPLGWCGGG